MEQIGSSKYHYQPKIQLILLLKIAHYLSLSSFFFISNIGIAQTKKTEIPFLIIKNVNVIDVINGKIFPSQDVAVKNEFIYFIGKSFSETVSPDSKYIDGKGRYLCPGLWDMHFHLCWDKNNDTLLFPALLKNGITGIRDMGGDLKIMNSLKTDLKFSSRICMEQVR